MSEASLQTAVANYLNTQERLFKGFTWFHPVNSMWTTKAQAGRHKSYGMRAGVPDCVILTEEGKTIFIELKMKKGSVSAQQKTFHEKLSSLGHPTYLVKTDSPYEAVTRVEEILNSHISERVSV